MTTTTNLGITHIDAAQFQKEVTMNAALDIIDKVTAGKFSHDFVADATLDIASSDAYNKVIELTDTTVVLTGTTEVRVPATVPKEYIVNNGTAQSIDFKTTGGAAVTVTTGSVWHVYCDGTDIIRIT